MARKVIVLTFLTPLDSLVLFPARTAISRSLELPFRGPAGCDMFVAPTGEGSIGRQAAVGETVKFGSDKTADRRA